MNGETMNGDEISAERLLPLPGEEPAAAVLTPEARKLRLLELALVLSVAFLIPTFSSLLHWWTNAQRSYDTGIDSVYRILQDTSAISVLAHAQYGLARSLRTIGLTARSSDISWTLAVTLCAKLLASGIVTLFFVYHVALPKTHPPPTYGFLKWLAVVPGAALEELIARAYLMTEVAALSGSMALAVIVSVGFQCFYHLYQGVPRSFTTRGRSSPTRSSTPTRGGRRRWSSPTPWRISWIIAR